MAYEQAAHYGGAPPRGYYDQQAPRGAPRSASRPRGPPVGDLRGPGGGNRQQYADEYSGYGQEGAHFQGHQQEYHGYDRESFWGEYGGDTVGHAQNYEQDYGHHQQYDQGYNQPQQRRGPPPSRGQMPRGDGYGPPRARGYSNGMNGQMGPGPGRGRGPPQGYPPQGPPRGGMQQYDDRRQMGGSQGGSPGDWRGAPGGERQKPRRPPAQPSQNAGFDNPFPVFGGAPTTKTDDQIMSQAMSGLDVNGRPNTDPSRRPTASGSVHSQDSSRSNYARHPGEHRGERPPRSSEDRYGPRPPHEGGRGPPVRAMTMPQDNEYPVDNRQFNQQQNSWPEQQYDAGYGPGRRDPIEQRSNTTMGDRPMGAGMPPPRPSTATGMRQQPGMQRRDDFSGDPRSAGPTFSPPFAGPPRPGTSNGVRPPARAPPPDLENWMPDFDAQPVAGRTMQDAVGLPLDAAPEATKSLTRAATVDSPMGSQFAQQAHKSRSQPDLRGQNLNGVAYGAPAGAPPMPAPMQGQYPGPRRDGPQLAMNNMQNFNSGMPASPRQFHRPGAPPLNRNETNQSGRSDPGPGGPPGPRLNGNSNPPVPSANPDALPVHPAPVRPGLAGGAQPGPAQIRQAQAQRLSMSDEKRLSMPVTHEELDRLRQAVQTNPADTKQALYFAKKLVEASQVLASDGGRADERMAQKNREKYIFDAHKQIKRLVGANCAEAMFYLADCYGTGQLGLAVDPKEAFGLYQSAAKIGHGASAYRTAVCCEMGLEAGGGTRKDPLKAVQWYKRAAALGDTPAMYKLGMILLKGLLGQQASIGEAIVWLQRAADKADEENPHALHELAQIYEHALPGGKVIPDQKYALQLYQKASKLGYRSSQTRLGKAYEYGHLGCQIDNRCSIHWYSKAAAQEDHDAELALSGWYLTGSQGILAASDQEAYLWARKAALAELPKAEFAMGYFSETGIGCPKSLEDAKRWYGRAASHRYPKAQARLEELIKGGGKSLKNRERMSRGDEKKHEDCVVM